MCVQLITIRACVCVCVQGLDVCVCLWVRPPLCIDPDDVQVTEVDALVVQERRARAALVADAADEAGGGDGAARGGRRHWMKRE